MTNVMKKVSALLLTVAMAVTMMPIVSARAFADTDTAFTVYVNGVEQKTITRTWMKANSQDPQIFSFVQASKRGTSFKYKVVKGPSYQAIIKDVFGTNVSLSDLNDAKIVWADNASDTKQSNNYDLPVADLVNGTKTIKLNKAITEEGEIKVEEVAGAEDVIPVVAYCAYEANTYNDAVTTKNLFVDDDKDILPIIGGNLTKETVIKTSDNKINSDSVNVNAKYSMSGKPCLNIILPTAFEKTSLVFTNKNTKAVEASFDGLNDTEAKIVYGTATWASSNKNVATVDGNGVVTPVADGTCTITANMSKGNAIIKCNVTVNFDLPTPATPANLKVKNVKKKSALLTWDASANATNYVVYRSKKKNSGYKAVATVNTNTYKNTKLKKNRNYYFKVQAVNAAAGKTSTYSAISGYKKVKIKK